MGPIRSGDSQAWLLSQGTVVDYNQHNATDERRNKVKAPSAQYPGTELEALTEAKNYYQWILSHFAPYLGKKVIEIGAGIGTFSSSLLSTGGIVELTLVEPAENLFPVLEQRLSRHPRVKRVCGCLDDLAASPGVDSVILVNVLEHLADDDGLLRAASRLLTPGGRFLIFVPAMPSLYGALDKSFGHVRRYTKALLAEKLEKAGLRVESLRYFNFPGLLTWYLAGKVLRWETFGPAGVRFYDRWVVPWASRLERRWEPPLGQSLIAAASKRETIE